MKNLTPRQTQVLEFIQYYIKSKGFSPSVRDIAKHFKMASAAGAHKHIMALVKKNYLSKSALISRTITLVNPPDRQPGTETVELPLMGYVAAGQPIEVIPQSGDTISFPVSKGIRENCYVLQVKGDSMIEDGIMDGDYVVIEPRDDAQNGETVVALLNGNSATLKRFYREKGKIRLQPANPTMEPIWIKDGDFSIQGVVLDLWRHFN